MRRVRFKRASATTPGRHGVLDWRVEFSDRAPTHSEIVFMVGMLLLAEDRYNGPNDDGRYRLWYFLDRLLCARSPEAIIDIAEDCDESVSNPKSVIKTRVA